MAIGAGRANEGLRADWQEQLAGTDPRDSLSALRAQVQIIAPERIMISWSAVPGRSYVLQWTTDPTEPFEELAGLGFPRVAQAEIETIELDLSVLATGRNAVFFRIEALSR